MRNTGTQDRIGNETISQAGALLATVQVGSSEIGLKVLPVKANAPREIKESELRIRCRKIEYV